jgi:TadE-like protein
MTEIEHRSAPKRRSRAGRSRGSEVLEFSLVLMPFFTLFFLQLTLSFYIFARVTLQQAVRSGVRYGITDTLKAGGPDNLTDCVKDRVQWAAGGLLAGPTGRAYIHVDYCRPPEPNTGGSCSAIIPGAADEAHASDGGNIMKVSVQGFPVFPLFPIITDWSAGAQKDALVLEAYAADKIETTNNPPKPF